MDWNIEAARSGKVPNPVLVEEITPKHEFGPLYRVGAVEGCQGKMRIIREYWDPSLDQGKFQTMWTLPEDPTGKLGHLDACSSKYHVCHNKEIRDNRPIPRIRYEWETRTNCQTAFHPNNIREGEGEWRRSDSNTSAAANNGWTFECDITKAKKGEYCVGVSKGILDNGVEDKEKHYIWVGEIKEVDVGKKTLRIVELRPTKDPWVKENMPKCKWTRVPGRPEEDMDNKSVISYFQKLKKDSCLPATLLRRVQEHAMWSVVPAPGVAPRPEPAVPSSNANQSAPSNSSSSSSSSTSSGSTFQSGSGTVSAHVLNTSRTEALNQFVYASAYASAIQPGNNVDACIGHGPG